ncbi:urease accessory protein UreD [Paracidovorax konjaci]|uniref:Urease accessory protein UreD n=1 Tax=Paracidovorax konjaci TaxID=32040 RepID=A0A1I1RIU8_9BURK|nr:urease accessory protein UreD [Paracidovorax konjaci]SFD33967.1 urease accessory protein [Paracidovorax konjaci]
MTWHARLQLDYRREGPRTVARFHHDGPLRILQSLYPEGDGICHNVLVHPPGGLVGGDTLDIATTVAAGAHGLVTTPGATRFYRSTGAPALQRAHAVVEAGGRLEWLPLEALCYSACQAENRLTLAPAPGAECIAWDVTALGLPHSGQPFAAGRFTQHIEVPGIWLERGTIDAADSLLMDGRLGLAGHRCMASVFFVAGEALPRERRETALDAARAAIDAHALRSTAGATSPHPQVVAVRVLAPVVEPAMELLRQVWGTWRQHLWGLSPRQPRIWAM